VKFIANNSQYTKKPNLLSTRLTSHSNDFSDSRSCGWGVKAGMVRVWVGGKTVRSPCYTRAISEHFRDKDIHEYKVLYKFSCLLLLYLLCCVNRDNMKSITMDIRQW